MISEYKVERLIGELRFLKNMGENEIIEYLDITLEEIRQIVGEAEQLLKHEVYREEYNVKKIDYKRVSASKSDEERLSSGETTELKALQEEFNCIFVDSNSNTGEEELKSDCWHFDNSTFKDKDKEKRFYEKVEKISSIPGYKYIIKFFLVRYKLAIGEKNRKGLWNYIEGENGKLKLRYLRRRSVIIRTD